MNIEITSALINKEYGRALQLCQVLIYKQAIEDADGNISKAARALDVSRSTLYNKIPVKKLI